MNLRNLLISAAVFATAPLFAATYYVTPEGAGTKDGSSWENAFDVEAFREQAAVNANGDIYNFAGGVYKPSATIVFQTATGATLNGNTDGERTIFSGDKNGNNNPDDGDMNRLMRFQTNTVDGVTEKTVAINNLDFTCVYTNISTTSSDTMGALMTDNCGNVVVTGCMFYGNWAQGADKDANRGQGGAAANIYRSTIKFINCTFRNNSANYRGGAIRLRSNSKDKGISTFENCIFTGNTNYHTFGGAIFVQNAKVVNIINSTIYNNKCAASGAAIYANGADATYANQVNIVNSTIAGNIITGDIPNGQISSTQSANLKIANSIVVSGNENTADFYFAGATANSKFSFVSGGFNYVGTVVDEAAPADNDTPAVRAEGETAAKINWLDTDTHGAACTYASIFGENKINDNNVIVPVKYVAGATNAQLKEATASWGLPAGVDLTKDINGDTRSHGSMPGSFAITESEIPTFPTSVITTIEDNAAARLVKSGNAIFTIEGAINGITVYNINGSAVAATERDTVDLGDFSNGIYILKSGNAVFKVLR